MKGKVQTFYCGRGEEPAEFEAMKVEAGRGESRLPHARTHCRILYLKKLLHLKEGLERLYLVVFKVKVSSNRGFFVFRNPVPAFPVGVFDDGIDRADLKALFNVAVL